MARVDSGPPILRVKKFTYDFSVDGGSIGTYTLGSLPDNVLVVAVAIDVPTAFTSSGGPSLSIGIENHGGAIESGAKGAVPWNGGKQITSDTALPHKTTAEEGITFIIGDAAVTAGVLHLWVQYYQSA